MATIGVVHVGWHGHVGPANRLSSVLAAAGHRVVAWAPAAFHPQLAAAGAEPRPLAWAMQSGADGGPAEPAPAFHRPAPARGARPALAVMHGIHELAVGLAECTLAVGEQLVEEAHAERVELVAHDTMAPWGRVAADWLGLPRLVSFPGFPPPFEMNAPPIAPAVEERLAVLRQAVARRWGVEFGSSREVLLSDGDLTVSFTTPLIAGRDAQDPAWRLVGPLMPRLAADGHAGAAEDDPRPLVYMALGTVHNWREDVFRAVIDGLASADVRLLVATGGRLAPESFDPLPPNATVVPRVDSRAVLQRAAVHVTHGGASSVHESLAAGVPMVCLPQGDDHHLWADRVRALGAGTTLHAADPEVIRVAVEELLRDGETRRRSQEIAEHVHAFPGEALVGAAVAELLG